MNKAGAEPVIINATNVGRYLDGIGTYTLNLLMELMKVRSEVPLIIYVNRTAAEHLERVKTSSRCTIRWVTKQISPDFGFRGHLLRLLFANWLGLRHRRSLIMTASQLEAIFFRSNQVIMIHDIIPLLFRDCHRKQYFYFRRLLPLVLRRAAAVLTPSNHTKGLLEQVYGVSGEKIKVIHHGVRRDRDLPAFPVAETGPYILFTGRIVRMKNITGVLKAFARVHERIPHRLVITGHGREQVVRQFRESKLNEYGIPPARVSLRGHVSTIEMTTLLKQADLLVFPSFYEGFGLPPLEAMAAGCPVIVSHAGSLPEICGDAACYVDPYDTEQIAAAIRRVVTDRVFRQELITKGRDRARRYCWTKSVDEHLRLLHDILERESFEHTPREEYAERVRVAQGARIVNKKLISLHR